MNCPVCDMPVKRGSLCANCGADSIAYAKAAGLSNKMYNKGLAQANSGNLSLAIEYLSKSVSYNKKNSQARNLLGLAQFQYGRVADAARHWVISYSFNRKNNPAKEYLAAVQEENQEFEKLCEAVENYNTALYYLHQRNEDMAIIQLKKSTELNPNFVDALNLLTLCHLISKDREKAAQTAEKVLSLDSANPIAMNYYKLLFPNKNAGDRGKKEPRHVALEYAQPKVPNSPILYAKPKKQFSMFHLASLVFFIVGVVCSFAYFTIVVIPPMLEESQNEAEAQKTINASITQDYEQRLRDKEAEYTALESKYDLLASDNEELESLYVRNEKIQKVNTAYNKMKENDLEGAAEILATIEAADLPIDTKVLYEDMIVSTVYPSVSKSIYNSGLESFNSNDYAEAKRLLEKANQYTLPGSANKPNVLYYLGLIADISGDTDTAVSYFESLASDYPDANTAVLNHAKEYLEQNNA